MSVVRQSRTRRALLALACLTLSLAALVAVYAAAVLTPTGQAIDTAVMTRLGELAGSTALAQWAAQVLGWISPLSIMAGTLAVGLLALVVHGARAAGAAVVTVVGTTLGAQLLKELLVRPSLTDTTAGTLNSLPSGHVAAVAGLLAGLVVGLRLQGSALAWLVAGGLTATVGLATVVLQWHRPSDVLASALLAVLVAAAAWWASDDGRVAKDRRLSLAA